MFCYDRPDRVCFGGTLTVVFNCLIFDEMSVLVPHN